MHFTAKVRTFNLIWLRGQGSEEGQGGQREDRGGSEGGQGGTEEERRRSRGYRGGQKEDKGGDRGSTVVAPSTLEQSCQTCPVNKL